MPFPRPNAHHCRSAALALASAGTLAASLTACSTPGRPAPDLAALYDQPAQALGPDRTPVVVIPGILGSRLVDTDTRQVVWGAFTYGAADPDFPDGARAVALPFAHNRPLADSRDRVEPDGVLDELIANVGPLRVSALQPYRGILLSLSAGRYTDRDLATAGEARRRTTHPPDPAQGPVDYAGQHFTCFQFDYDWRRDLSEHAQRLDLLIQAAARLAHAARNAPADAEPPRVDVVAHSMGGLVLMYYLRFGTQPLPDDGSVPPVTWAGARRIRHAVLVGTPSAGSVLALRQLVEGVNYSPITPTYQPAVLGTMPAVFQLMPRARHARVIDAATKQPVDPTDPAVWRRYRWGLADPAQRDYLAWLLPGVPDPAVRQRIALAHLDRVLARTRQLQAALDQPAPPLPPGCDLRLFAGDSESTPDLLEVDPATGRLRVASTAPGDGTVTRASALLDERAGTSFSPTLRTPIPWSNVHFLHADHIALTDTPEFTDNLLFLLLER
ncbi:MAG: hypothetical protein JNK35_01810 [Phycisphaerae bacterium]|nr:hypothetical protein [Phycisphaerae bacterium]